jgi:RNA recognition motif-containing protein
MTGQGSATGGTGSGYSGAPNRNYEDRTQHREQAMNNIRETSQQDRRVYVGNLSYDVKWHHLKDFMRQGGLPSDNLLQCYPRMLTLLF